MPIPNNHFGDPDFLEKYDEALLSAPPPNPHGALLGTLQSREPGDTLLEGQITTDDVRAATALDTGIELQDLDPQIVQWNGRQLPETWPASADADHQTPDSEHLDSLVDVGLNEPANVSEKTLAAIGEQVVRQCIADAFRAWPDDVCDWMSKTDRDPSNAETPLRILYQKVLQNLRAADIGPSAVWPLVKRIASDGITSIFQRVFGDDGK